MVKKATKPGAWIKGQSGNPAGKPPGTPNKATGLRAAFAGAKATDLLDLVWGHAFNDPTTARWLAERLFGGGNWNPIVSAQGATTPDACRQALDAALDAHLQGQIDTKELATVTTALEARLGRLAALNAPGEAA